MIFMRVAIIKEVEKRDGRKAIYLVTLIIPNPKSNTVILPNMFAKKESMKWHTLGSL